MQQTSGVLKLSLPVSEQTHFSCSTSAGRQGTSEQGQRLGDISPCGDGLGWVPSVGFMKVPGEES